MVESSAPIKGANAYIIEERNRATHLGHGAFANVFKVTRICDGQVFACKKLKIEETFMTDN